MIRIIEAIIIKIDIGTMRGVAEDADLIIATVCGRRCAQIML